MPGRFRPIAVSSSRVMRIITGCPVFFASSAGIISCTYAGFLPPNAPPVYSLMTTRSAVRIPIIRAIPTTDCARL